MNNQRVCYLLERLRQRTPEEIGSAVMLCCPSLTPEFWQALDLLRAERRDKEAA
jgi:hypothetical protein